MVSPVRTYPRKAPSEERDLPERRQVARSYVFMQWLSNPCMARGRDQPISLAIENELPSSFDQEAGADGIEILLARILAEEGPIRSRQQQAMVGEAMRDMVVAAIGSERNGGAGKRIATRLDIL